MAHIIGYYNRMGYRIDLFDDHSCVAETLYEAGNNRHESDPAQSLPPQFRNALNLRTIRRYCLQTAKDIAGETNTKLAGIEREEEPDSPSDEA